MRWSKKRWALKKFKLGTGPGLSYFVRVLDVPRLIKGQHVQIRRFDGVTNPDFQHDEGALIEEVRSIGSETLYVAEKF